MGKQTRIHVAILTKVFLLFGLLIKSSFSVIHKVDNIDI